MDKYIFTEIMEEYLDSSDSDNSLLSSSEIESSEASEDDDLIVLAALRNIGNCIETYFKEVIPKYTDEDFMMHFRVRKDEFEMLSNKFRSPEEFKKLDEIKVYSGKMHLALFLWFAGHEACSIRDIGDRFNVSIRTASRMISRVIYFISRMSNIYIKWPNDEEKRITSEYVKNKTGLSGVIGAKDGTHTSMRVDIPKELRDYFIDRKNVVSIQMQGICNEKKKFIDMYVGFPGSANDSRVHTLCHQYYILGDSAYPCTNYIITPFNAFGLLKQRFRQLYYCKLRGIEKFCHFVRACVVLHNLCDDNLELIDAASEIDNGDDLDSIPMVRDGALRHILCEQLN